MIWLSEDLTDFHQSVFYSFKFRCRRTSLSIVLNGNGRMCVTFRFPNKSISMSIKGRSKRCACV